MKKRFTPCPSCARHVSEGDCVCPFCGAKAPCAKPLRRIAQRLSRAAMHAAGAAGAAVVLGDCTTAGTPDYGFACAPDACSYPVDDHGADAADASAPGDGGDGSALIPDAGYEAGSIEGGSDGEAGPTDGGSDGAAPTPDGGDG